MASTRRTTNNSVSTLDEQSAVIESVLTKEKNTVTSKKEDKKRRIKRAEKEAKKVRTSSAVSVPAQKELGEEIESDDMAESGSEGTVSLTWEDAKAQMQAHGLQYVNPYGLNLGISQEQWDNPNLVHQPPHDISDDDVSDLTSMADSEVSAIQPQPAVTTEVEQQLKLVGSGALADFLREEWTHVKESDKVSTKLDDCTAKVVNKMLKESLHVTDMEKLAKNHPRVENVDFMKVPRLDMEVFQVVEQKVRNLDQSLQSIQKGVLASVSALSPVLSLLIQRGDADEELNKVGRNLGESIKLLAYVNNILSSKRRDLIKPYLAPVYAQVLTKGHDTTPDWLYGGDLVTTTRKCEASQKLAQKILKPKSDSNPAKSQSAKRFKGPKNTGMGMLRGFNPLQPQNIRFPSPQMIQEFIQAQMGLAGQPRQFGVWLPKPIPTATVSAATRESTTVVSQENQFQPEVNLVSGSDFDGFKGGQIKNHLYAWKTVTRDPWVLDVVQGLRIPFTNIPSQSKEPFPYRLSAVEREAALDEINKLISLDVLEIAQDEPDQFISNIFLRPKKDGSYRMILDLTIVNKSVQYLHFKMHSLNTAVEMMRPSCWMGSIDLRHAYYSVLMHEEDRKFLRFRWNDILYQYKAMPNGLACAPRFFTKILNPVFAYLRNQGHELFQYLDDSFVIADTEEKCRESLLKLCDLLEQLGFVVHRDKSILKPTRKLVFLGFDLDSEQMLVSLTSDKVQKFKTAALELLQKETYSIREVAGLIGLMIAYSPAFDYSLIHVKNIEREKIEALGKSRGSFEGIMTLSDESVNDIHWWLHNIELSGKHILICDPDIFLYTDASEEGWGAHVNGISSGGRWNQEESLLHINVLELKAIWFALRSFCKEDRIHVHVLTDNTTALAYIKNMGGVRSLECNQIAYDIWLWAEERNIWLTISHIPGVENVVADYKSRHFSDNVEWALSWNLFDKICTRFGCPDIDLFASRLNKKLEMYVSWTPDPYASNIDAFSMNWRGTFFYAFPPFSCILKVINKALRDNATGVLVVPWWPTQPWWARLQNLRLQHLRFKAKANNLTPVGKPRNINFINSCPLGAFLFMEDNS